MKKILSIITISILLVTSAYADAKTGQKVYLKTFKGKFDNMNGTKFAAEHTTEEWTLLFDNDAKEFIKVYSEKFPKAKTILENPENLINIQNVGDFAKEYSSDSGNVPSC